MHEELDKLIESLHKRDGRVMERLRRGSASGEALLREIVLDTETTGLDPFDGHRVVEIGCVELVNCIPTGRVWHCHVNPEREVPYQAFEVHGLSTEFLRDKPRFAELADDMLAFIEGAVLVMHNAAFDFGFLNAELERAARPLLRWDRVVDTLALARRRHPGAPCSLDALCKRYGIDLSEREKHGALLDCRLLAGVYVELVGGHQARLDFAINGAQAALLGANAGAIQPRPRPLAPRLSAAEIEAHRRFRRDARRRGALAPLLILRLLASLRLREVLRVEPAEIDRVEHQRREAPIADHVGKHAAQEREQQRRAIDEQHRLEQVLRNPGEAEQPAIDQLDIVDDALVALGVHLELERDLVSVLAARPGIHVDADLELRVLPGPLQRLRRARALEGEVLDVLGEHGELGLLARARCGLRRRRGRLGGAVAIRLRGFAFRLLFRHLGFQPSSVWLARDRQAPQIPRGA